MGFYPADYLIQDAQHHGVGILPLDVRQSGARWTVEGATIRVGLRTVRGLGPAACQRIAAVMRHEDPPASVHALCARADLGEREATALATSGALTGLEAERRQAIWQAPRIAADARQPLLPGLAETAQQTVRLPAMTAAEETRMDYAALGFSVGRHVMEHLRPELAHLTLHTSATVRRVRRGDTIEVAGQAIARQRPGAAQGTVFLSLSDEWGIINVVVSPDVYGLYRRVIRSEVLLRLRGTIERRYGVVSLQARAAWPLAESLASRPTSQTHLPHGKEYC